MRYEKVFNSLMMRKYLICEKYIDLYMEREISIFKNIINTVIINILIYYIIIIFIIKYVFRYYSKYYNLHYINTVNSL